MNKNNNEYLRGAVAFESIRRLLKDQNCDASSFEEPPFVRLANAIQKILSGSNNCGSPLDLAVLIRQALRYHDLQESVLTNTTLEVRKGKQWPVLEDWKRVGIDAHPVADGYLIKALPWRPEWLANVSEIGVDGSATGEAKRLKNNLTPGDPFLARFNRQFYRSQSQQSAMRTAVMMPSGSTLLVCLPTGDGKSFIFQLISELGFDGELGLTLVITPTVALALDHERAAIELGLPGNRFAYRGGDLSGENSRIFEDIENGMQRLCFASPEAACGPLRRAIVQAAKTGNLRTIVIDEAHLVETWGANFRSQFQVFAGLRNSLLQTEGGKSIRTILLSATVTNETVSTLKNLFGHNACGLDLFAVYTASRLRPEPEYWIAPLSNEDERRKHVLEAILHLPRPAILYVTLTEHADQWLARLKETGFRRVARLSGDTSTQERQAIIDQWSKGDLDLVVGTSAFGLGIDNKHVRTVIHGCIPENLDRFYQEVGRGGRDGRASVSLIVPTEEDMDIAKNINEKKLITIDRGLDRWTSMFNNPSRIYDEATDTHSIRLDVAPGMDTNQIDMISNRSTEWNIHTLNLMANAGIITLIGAAEFQQLEENNGDIQIEVNNNLHPYQIVRILEASHLNPEIWEKRVEAERQRLKSANKANLKRMWNFLRTSDCAAKIIAPLYELNGKFQNGIELEVRVGLACGGCPHCRSNGVAPYQEISEGTLFPWKSQGMSEGVGLRLLDEGYRVVVFYPIAYKDLPINQQRRFLTALASLIRSSQIHNVIGLSNIGMEPVILQDRLVNWFIFTSERLTGHSLPPGPEIVFLDPKSRILSSILEARPNIESARFLFIDENAEDPFAPGTLLKNRYRGRQITLSRFIWEVES